MNVLHFVMNKTVAQTPGKAALGADFRSDRVGGKLT